MRFPTVGQYIESLANPQGLFRTLRDVVPLRNPYGELRLYAGNFSVVFKVGLPVQEKALSGMTGMGHYALKCYTRPCGRIGRVCAAVGALDVPYLVRCRYLPEELYVYDEYERGAYFPAVLSEWVEGETLGRHVARLCGAGRRSPCWPDVSTAWPCGCCSNRMRTGISNPITFWSSRRESCG